VRLTRQDHVVSVHVEDDGRGIADADEPQLGLLGMRERVTALGGQVEVGRSNAGGVRVAARIPLEARA
jgi:signal transduction histidine kinase